MTQYERSAKPQQSYGRHVGRTLITLGVILLAAVTLGLTAEIALQAMRAAPGDFELVHKSLRGTAALTLVSLQAALPIVGALVAAPLLAARLFHQLHGTTTLDEAHDRLNHFLFGALGVQRRLMAREGQIVSGDDTVIQRVGGPASLTVYGDTAVLTEQQGRLKRVLGRGVHTLDRYEKVWETVDLRPQRWVRQVFALTKEGIPVSCDVDVLFGVGASPEDAGRQRRAREGAHATGASLPYGEETVLRAATSKWIAKEDGDRRPMNWEDRVAALVEGAVRDILATYRLDWLIRAPQPDQEHPRDEIHQRLKVELEDQLPEVGAKLLEVDLGRLRVGIRSRQGSEVEEISEMVSEIISEQWIDAWQASWKARALTSRAEGEAELLRIDAARIQAQAEMIIGLTEALQPMVSDHATSEPYFLALRLVEALQWMSYDPSTRDYMPPEAMRTLNRLQELLGDELTTTERGDDSEAGGEET